MMQVDARLEGGEQGDDAGGCMNKGGGAWLWCKWFDGLGGADGFGASGWMA